MSDLAPPNGQRFLQHDRESFFDAQRRNRHATWRISALCLLATLVMGIPLTLVVTPLLYGIALAVADVINLFSPLPSGFWTIANDVARLGFAAVSMVTGQQKSDPQTVLLGSAVLLLPGAVLSVGLWLAMSLLFRRAGVGGALLALQAREPNRNALEELRLVNVVEEMSIAAGLPVPGVMLIDAPGANTAAIGTSPADARIIVSRPLLDSLTREELEGALAHVVASIGNGDLRIAFRVTAVFETLGLLVAMLNAPFGRQSRGALWRILRYGLIGSPSGTDGSKEAAALAAILTRNLTADSDDIDRFFDTTAKKSVIRSIRSFLFFPIFFTNLAIKLSLWFFSFAVLGPSVALVWRTRRYLADASAVQLTRDPDSLAGALQKLNDNAGPIPGGDWASYLFLVNPSSARGAQSQPSARQQEMLARAWLSTGPTAGSPTQGHAGDFAALMAEAVTTYRAAVAGDAKAGARIAALKQSVMASDPTLGAQIPDPADLSALLRQDPTAIARLRALREPVASSVHSGTATQATDESGGTSPVSFLGFHPSLKRRLKRLDRMGAHVSVAATDKKATIVAIVLGLLFAPFVVLLIGLFLLLIAIITMASLTFLAVWLAFIHQIFVLVAPH